MAVLEIGDLAEDRELDAQAMRALTGGRTVPRARASNLEHRFRARARFHESPIVPGLIRTVSLRDN